MQLRIFYDGQCPLCVEEMRQLKFFDHRELIELQDINQAEFTDKFPHIDRTEASDILHAETETGTLLLGLDVTAQAWGLVNQKPWIQLLRTPLLRGVSDKAYLVFAKNRFKISRLLTGKARCDEQSCGVDKQFD
ncbi:thiol-disulfide oxidoreductase DCC family protein [Agarivorans sp. 1_MG-2023]|uniref:thiol-disulfide oxidoreductase DCC family protein n=1 Tax=Agarivorans sp. 1_MG-2023 TaxID=3062634 RepID=UPI0026E234C5|nr:DUF393 domain-containing protein [Agarivorans sp. 1_MG-2023]MDO6762668.1 DUF393 domain-containing protein [Agarivorans sp. 1_MG-2023]